MGSKVKLMLDGNTSDWWCWQSRKLESCSSSNKCLKKDLVMQASKNVNG